MWGKCITIWSIQNTQAPTVVYFDRHFACTYVESFGDVVMTLDQGEVLARSTQTDVEVMIVVRSARREQFAAVHARYAGERENEENFTLMEAHRVFGIFFPSHRDSTSWEKKTSLTKTLENDKLMGAEIAKKVCTWRDW